MLPRKYRASRISIEDVIKNGTIVSADFIYAKISRGVTKNTNFAVVVPKKTEKTSVGRHLIKRRVNSVIENYIENLPDLGKTIVFFVKKTEKQPSFKDIKSEIYLIFQKILKK